MAGQSDCVVVGGGLIGLLTARELVSAGMSVTVLERNPAVGQESSWAGGGILSPLYPWRYRDEVTRLASWSQQHYPAFAAELLDETGIDPQWQRSGLLMLDAGAQAQPWLEQHGHVRQQLDAVELQEMEPALAHSGADGLLMPEIAHIRNPRLLKAARRSLELRGVNILEGLTVSEILQQGGRVSGVACGRERFPADHVVVAGGAWTARILGALGEPVPVEPVRGQMLLFRARPGLLKHILLYEGRYAIPRRDGRILMGSTMERVGFDKSTTRQALDELRKAAYSLLPALRESELERHWAGLRPGSPEGVPVIGVHPQVAGLYINSGHFRNGVVTGPASARLLTQIILGKQTLADAAPYAPQALVADCS